MPTPASGAITFSDIRNNFYNYTNFIGYNYGTTDSNLYNMNYYRGKRYRKAGNTGVFFPSGTITFNDFYNSDGNCQCDCLCACDCACSTDSACFPEDTLVNLRDGTKINIIDLEPGDKICSGNENIVNTVLAVHKVKLGSRKLYSINGKISTTGDHLFKTSNGWASIEPNLYKQLRQDKKEVVNGMLIDYGYVNSSEVLKLDVGSILLNGETVQSIDILEASENLVLYCPIVDNINQFIVEDIVADAPIIFKN